MILGIFITQRKEESSQTEELGLYQDLLCQHLKSQHYFTLLNESEGQQ